jgi:ParB-like chromosome segregation protein Spo0J
LKLKKVKPETIKVPEVRVTARFDEEKLQMLRSAMAKVGQASPIICIQVGEDMVLVDGLHRLQEAIAAKWPTIDVYLDEGDMVDVLTRNIFLDHIRGKHPVSEMRKTIEALYKEYSVSIEDIVAKTGFSQDYVEKLLIISELTPFSLEALDQEKIGLGHAFALTKLKDPVQQEIALQNTITYRWTVRQLEDFVKEVRSIQEQRQTPPPPGPPPPAPKVACGFCRDQYEPAELKAFMMCPTCVNAMFQLIALERQAAKADEAKVGVQGGAGGEGAPAPTS